MDLIIISDIDGSLMKSLFIGDVSREDLESDEFKKALEMEPPFSWTKNKGWSIAKSVIFVTGRQSFFDSITRAWIQEYLHLSPDKFTIIHVAYNSSIQYVQDKVDQIDAIIDSYVRIAGINTKFAIIEDDLKVLAECIKKYHRDGCIYVYEIDKKGQKKCRCGGN